MKVMTNCPTCEGKGHIKHWVGEPPVERPYWDECPRCDGEGKLPLMQVLIETEEWHFWLDRVNAMLDRDAGLAVEITENTLSVELTTPEAN